MALHYRKDGGLDMRFSSSKAAVAGGGFTSRGFSIGAPSMPVASFSYTPAPAVSRGPLRKDGMPDMRYKVNRVAAVQVAPAAPVARHISSGHYTSSGGGPLKKDGTPDMRYTVNKQRYGSGGSGTASKSSRAPGSRVPGIHYKADGTPDMRYKSSREYVAQTFGSQAVLQRKTLSGGIPLRRDGLPDMRFKVSKEYVEREIAAGNSSLVPLKKDGTVDLSDPIGRMYAAQHRQEEKEDDRGYIDVERQREDYWRQQQEKQELLEYLQQLAQTMERQQMEPMQIQEDSSVLRSRSIQPPSAESAEDWKADIFKLVPEGISDISKDLQYSKDKEIGRGSFGVVYKGVYKGKPVAVKELHLERLRKKDKANFVRELGVLAKLNDHPNIIKLIGYCAEPPAIVMSFAQSGNLAHLLYYDESTEADGHLACGSWKKHLLFGICNALQQIHRIGIIHGDIKPQNVLLDESYSPLLADFGLAKLRVQAQSTTASISQGQDDVGDAGGIGGTPAYMAPELLDPDAEANYASDVYSFGIMMNEILTETSPFEGDYKKLHGKGPFAVVNYAKNGNRPPLPKDQPLVVRKMIEQCWNADPKKRPTFADLIKTIVSNPDFKIKDRI